MALLASGNAMTSPGWVVDSFDHFIGASQQRRWHSYPEFLRDLEVDRELVFGWRLHRQLGRLFSLQDEIDISCCCSMLVDEIGSIRQQASRADKKPFVVDRRQLVSGRQRDDQRRPKEKPPEECEAWNSQSTPADCRARKVSSIKKSGLSRSCLVLQARTPLTIVAHILPGRRLVVRPTLGAMQSSSAARYHGADCLSTAQPAAADAHRTAAATEPRGEGRG